MFGCIIGFGGSTQKVQAAAAAKAVGQGKGGGHVGNFMSVVSLYLCSRRRRRRILRFSRATWTEEGVQRLLP